MGEYADKLKVVFEAGLDDLPQDVPVFGTRPWLEATSKAVPRELRVLRIYKGETLAAFLPLHCERRGYLSLATVPFFAGYGGPYFVGERRRHFNEELRQRFEIQREVLAFLERNFHHCRLLPDEFDARAALERGWTCAPRYTLLCRLGSPESLEPGPAATASLREAERLGLRLGESGEDAGFATAGAAVRAPGFETAGARRGAAMRPQPGWAADLKAALQGSGLLESHSVYTPEGREIARAGVALDRRLRTAFLWEARALPEAGTMGAWEHLYHGLLRLYREDFDIFDFGDTDHIDPADPREKFARELAARHALEKRRGPVARAMLAGYMRLRGAGG